MAQETEHKFATKLREKKEQAAAGDVKAQKYLDSSAAQVLQDYLDPHPITGAGGVPESRGGGLGAIRENDPVLSAGSEASQLARENLLYQPGGIGRRGNLTAADIKGINVPLVRQGLSDEDYFRFNQMLYSPNIEEYEEARPISSGKSLRDIVTMVTPAKYFKKAAETIGGKVLEVPEMIMGSEMVESIKEDWKGRKKGRGIAGFVEDILTTVGIGNTKKTNEFIKTQDSSNDAAILRNLSVLEDLVNTPLGADTEIKTNIRDIKADKKKENGSADYLTEKFSFKKGGIASLATGGLLEQKERVPQPFSPLNSAMNYGISSLGGLGSLFGQGGPRGGPRQWPIQFPPQIVNQDPYGIKPMGEQITGFGETLGGFGETLGGYGEQIGGFGEQLGGYEDALGGYGQDISSFKETMGGFGSQFENINNKLTSMEEGIASLSEKVGTTQGNTQPQGRPNFGYGFNAYNPWMFGGFGRGRYG